MTKAETAKLLTLAAVYDNRTFDDLTVGAWHDALDGLRFEDCVEAVKRHYRITRDWIMPSDVRKHAVVISNDRAENRERQQLQALEASPVGREKADERLAQVHAMGLRFGRIPQADPVHPTVDPETASAARSRHCPWCKAVAGQPCTTPGTGRPLSTLHPSRVEPLRKSA